MVALPVPLPGYPSEPEQASVPEQVPVLVPGLGQVNELVLESSPGPESGRVPGPAQVLGSVQVLLVWPVAAWLQA